ncbi:MAG: zinc ABC transporter substrate-binding protein [Myxococcota bacterium]
MSTSVRSDSVSVRRLLAASTAIVVAAMSLNTGGCSSRTSNSDKVGIVAAENEYGDVASQIGGDFVTVTSIESNPNTDPHTYEVSPQAATDIRQAHIVIQNGVGYDDWVQKIEAAAPNPNRKNLNVQELLNLPDSTRNPHLWYKPATMPAVAAALVKELSRLQPKNADYFKENEKKFNAALEPWLEAIESFKSQHGGSPVATTEPVADYLLEAMGISNQTPWNLQAAIMNGTDPTPQDVSFQNELFNGKKVKAFVYNQQVTDQLTDSFKKSSKENQIPIVGVYETMPAPGFNYQSWMLAETEALQKAIVSGISKESL